MKKTILKSLPLLTISLISFLAIILIGATQANAQLNFEAQVPIPGMEGVVPVGTKDGGQIQSTLLGEYVKNIYNYSFAVAGILAAIVLMGGGVMWLVSGGNQSSISKAKEFISGSLIGLGILFSAYILLRTINPALLEMRPISIDNISESALRINANEINCCQCILNNVKKKATTDGRKQVLTCEAIQGLTFDLCYEICKEQSRLYGADTFRPELKPNHSCNYAKTTQMEQMPLTQAEDSGDKICVQITYGDASSYETEFIDDPKWKWDPGIKEQTGDMSPELAQFLNCMRAKLPPYVGRISSISDSGQIGSLTNCEGDSWTDDDCVHTKDSCHYGGGLGTNKSYAVDFGDAQFETDFIKAAKICDKNPNVKKETNAEKNGSHIHISISKCPKQ